MATMSISRLRHFVFSAILIIGGLAVLEGTCRVIESVLAFEPAPTQVNHGWQTAFFRSLFDWNEPDPYLLWRFKANLNSSLVKTNSRGLIGDEVHHVKDSSTFRLMILGDSSPVGIGLESRSSTFGEVLRRRLNSELPEEMHVEVINASVVGYSSEQIVRFMQHEGWRYEPDLIILYCGNNDASISGGYSDRELLKRQSFQVLRRHLSRSALYRILRSIIRCALPQPHIEPSHLKVRVNPDQFGGNLKWLVDECDRRSCSLIILKPAVPLMWPAALQFKMFRQVKGEQGELIMPPVLRELLGRQVKYCLPEGLLRGRNGDTDKFTQAVFRAVYHDSLLPEESIAYWQECVLNEGATPVHVNNLGVSYWEAGEFGIADSLLRLARELYSQNYDDEASEAAASAGSPFLYNIGVNLISKADANLGLAYEYLDSALQADYLSLRIKDEYLEQIDQLVRDNHMWVINLHELFMDNGADSLFVDHCHPTAEGHALIARELQQLILTEIIAGTGGN